MSALTTEREALTVELYVCPECLAVGKIPQGRGSPQFRGMCTGEAGKDHKRVGMKLVTFREVRDEA